jgi:hypothetical protein
VQAIGLEPAQVLVERVDEDRERQIALELGRRAREDEPAARVRATANSASRRVLPIPGSPTSSIAAAPLIDLGEGPIERAELLGAAHELVG